MDIFCNLDEVVKRSNIVVALGNFDGVHLGHRELIRYTVEMAGEEKCIPAVFTFDPHPLKVLRPEICPPMILSKQDKINLMYELEVQFLVIAPFSLDFARITPARFVKDILVDKLGVKGIVVGYNYAFGFKGEGSAETLVELASTYGIRTKVVPPVKCNGTEVSSTLIRSLIADGNVAEAASFLGYHLFIKARVVSGDQRGRQIGFPTANIELPEDVLYPANGVYAVRVSIDGESFRGVANLGLRPTFKLNCPRNLEIHILDFCKDIYGREIKAEFIERIRGERQFASVDELIQQIQQDVGQAVKILR